jgi:hypothetical protein
MFICRPHSSARYRGLDVSRLLCRPVDMVGMAEPAQRSWPMVIGPAGMVGLCRVLAAGAFLAW